jgi:PncC family amidohydrolase
VSDDTQPLNETSTLAPLEQRLNQLLGGDAGISIAAAESCTGGKVAHRITSIAGSSVYFLGSIVSYANSAKMALLGVSAEILEARGAVSEECARAMAEGAIRAFGADVAVSTTGIAGPGGSTERKPVGLVYFATAGPSGIVTRECHFSGDRIAVIDAATETALEMLLAEVETAISLSRSVS